MGLLLRPANSKRGVSWPAYLCTFRIASRDTFSGLIIALSRIGLRSSDSVKRSTRNLSVGRHVGLVLTRPPLLGPESRRGVVVLSGGCRRSSRTSRPLLGPMICTSPSPDPLTLFVADLSERATRNYRSSPLPWKLAAHLLTRLLPRLVERTTLSVPTPGGVSFCFQPEK